MNLSSTEDLWLIRPVICYCSGSQYHKTDHIECRCDGAQRRNAASKEFSERYRAKNNPLDTLWPKSKLPLGGTDEDGYSLCRYCNKIRWKDWLVQCPYCDKFFKGPTFWYNKKFHYECESCG